GVTARAPEVDGPTRLRFARAVDELGLDSLWVPDHPIFATDCWTALAAYAAVTGRVRLGPMVSCHLYPSALAPARQAADVDRLSGGRAVLGIGAGWLAFEFELMGLSLPDPPERLAALRRTLAELRRRWSGARAEVDLTTMRASGEALWWPPV